MRTVWDSREGGVGVGRPQGGAPLRSDKRVAKQVLLGWLVGESGGQCVVPVADDRMGRGLARSCVCVPARSADNVNEVWGVTWNAKR